MRALVRSIAFVSVLVVVVAGQPQPAWCWSWPPAESTAAFNGMSSNSPSRPGMPLERLEAMNREPAKPMSRFRTAVPDWREADQRSRDRIVHVTARVKASGAERTELADGWTIPQLIAHIGVWDSLTAARWRDAQAAGKTIPGELPQGLVDFVNAGTLPLLATLTLDAALALAERGAQELADILGGVDDDSVLEAYRLGRSNLVDRSRHRAEHLDAIEEALG